jgi:carboxyl-terminal processing protease
MSKPNSKIYLPILFALLFALGYILGRKSNGLQIDSLFNASKGKHKINRLLDLIDREYVDEVNTDSIVDLTVNGILEKLDPHSVYIPKSKLAQVTESMEGNFVGIGINFYMYKDTLTVLQPILNGPSYRAGIQAGDRILVANNKQLFNKKLTNEQLFTILKGEMDTKVNLLVYRKAEKRKFNVTISRAKIPVKSVEIALMLQPKKGYIKVNRFAETTYSEFHQALVQLKQQGMTEVIVDLRGNGGGYLEMAVAMADEFLKKDELIVKTKNRAKHEELSLATEKGIFESGKISVLVDENSASASEIFAGAIQDNDRGSIIGRRTFGKGLVQKEMKLDDGSAVRLTVARYYTPSGRSIQKPYSDKNYFNEFEKRFASGELYQKDSIKVVDSLRYKTKKGRIVYGGGGIIPDVFVPLTASHDEEGLTLLLQTDFINYFAFEKVDAKRLYFKEFTQPTLKKEIYENPLYFKQFQDYVTQNGFSFKLAKHKTEVIDYLYAAFTKQLFGDKAYYQIVLPKDKMIKRAL